MLVRQRAGNAENAEKCGADSGNKGDNRRQIHNSLSAAAQKPLCRRGNGSVGIAVQFAARDKIQDHKRQPAIQAHNQKQGNIDRPRNGLLRIGYVRSRVGNHAVAGISKKVMPMLPKNCRFEVGLMFVAGKSGPK